MLSVFDGLPEGLLECGAKELYRVLDGPTLIHLPGRHEQPLFVSVLLHGNEDTGWEAVRSVLQRHSGKTLPRALSIFIGNVTAARTAQRHLKGQPDYNRIWNGGGTPEHGIMRQVTKDMQRRGVFASIDIHNNTGLNPHYACINQLEHARLHLATLFSRTVVYFIKPDSVQSMAFGRFCPAVTVECGKPGQAHGVEHARDFVEAALQLTAIPDHPVSPHDYDLYHTVAIVKVKQGVDFGFEDEGSTRDMVLRHDLDRLNFQELPAGTSWARANKSRLQVEAWDEQGENVAEDYFVIEDGELRTRLPVMPSMLTLDKEIIRQDCLGYLMERLPALSSKC